MVCCSASDGSAIAYPLACFEQRTVHGGLDVSHDILAVYLDRWTQPRVGRPGRDIRVFAKEVGAVAFVGDTPVAITGPLTAGIALGAVLDEAQVEKPVEVDDAYHIGLFSYEISGKWDGDEPGRIIVSRTPGWGVEAV